MKYFYVANLAFLAYIALIYMMFRCGMNDYFRLQRISKTKIRKSKKGKKNYWWYEQLHEEYGFDKFYYLNKMFTITYLLALILNIFFGWLKIFSIPVGILVSLCSICSAIMFYSSSIQINRRKYGKSIMLFLREFANSIIDILMAFYLLLIAFREIKLLNGIWHFIK